MALQRTVEKNYAQRGSILIVSLVVLAVLAVLAASTLSTSTLQERMSSNARQQAIAVASAESALRETENWLTNEVNSIDRLTDHFISSPTQGCYADRDFPVLAPIAARHLSQHITDLSSQKQWLSDTNSSRAMKAIAANWKDGDWARSPRVVVELLGPVRSGFRNSSTGSTQNMDTGAPPSLAGPWVFRLTAIGWSKNPDIYSVLQTTYTTGRQFGG